MFKLHISYSTLTYAHYLLRLWICELQVMLIGDTRLNPGPKPNLGQNFSVRHWNLNNIPAHNFSKILLH